VTHPGNAPAPLACPMNLRDIRVKAGRSLEEIAERTKISMLFLRAIEAEEFRKLPGGIFDTSYLRQYAAEIGLPPEPLLELYRSRMGLGELPPAQPRRSVSTPRRWLRFLSPEGC